MKPIANAWLICDFTAKFNMPFAITTQPQTQLSLHGRELRRTFQRFEQWFQFGQKLRQFACDYGGGGFTAKPARPNANLNCQPIVIVILTDWRALIAMHLNLDPLLIRMTERKYHGITHKFYATDHPTFRFQSR